MTIQFGGEYDNPPQLQATVQEIQRRSATKADLLVAARDLHVRSIGPDQPPNLIVPVGEHMPPSAVPITPHALSQLAGYYPIGTRYARILAEGDTEDQAMLGMNFDHWFARSQKRHLVRTLDNKVRSVQSDAYRIIDNEDILMASLDTLQKTNAELTRVDLTDDHMRIRALVRDWRTRIERHDEYIQKSHSIYRTELGDMTPREDGSVPYFTGADDLDVDKRDWVIPGIQITNSEVGLGRVQVQGFILVEICMNGTVMDTVLGQRHVGRHQSELDGFLSPETFDLENQVMFGTIKDYIASVFDQDKFMKIVERASQAASTTVEDTVKEVNDLVVRYKLPDEDKQRIINQFVLGGDPTQWGLINAVTAMAHSTVDLEVKNNYETIGGRELVRVRA